MRCSWYKKMMKRNIQFALVFVAFLAIFIAGCSKGMENKPASNIAEEPAADTGILSVRSSPDSAQVYVDGELKGNTPLELYNLPVGKYDVAVKKEGYSEFKKSADVKVGKTEEVEAVLNPLKAPAPEPAEQKKPVAENAPLNAATPSQKLNKIAVNKSFIVYYDFKNELFTDITSGNSDVFSSNYNTYIYFTAYAPAKMRIVDKQITEVRKEDCINADDTIDNLYSGQTLCVKTINGVYAAVGGSWKTAPGELQWILFS